MDPNCEYVTCKREKFRQVLKLQKRPIPKSLWFYKIYDVWTKLHLLLCVYVFCLFTLLLIIFPFIHLFISFCLFCRYGRKVVLCVSGLLQFSVAISQPYFGNFILYCVSLYFYGMFGSGESKGVVFTFTDCQIAFIHYFLTIVCIVLFSWSLYHGLRLK